MKRGPQIVIGLMATVLTYTSLMLVAGSGRAVHSRLADSEQERYFACRRSNRGHAERAASITSTREHFFQRNPQNKDQ